MYEQFSVMTELFISEVNVLQKKPSKRKQRLNFDFWQNYRDPLRRIFLLLVPFWHVCTMISYFKFLSINKDNIMQRC